MIEKSGRHFKLCSKLYDYAAYNGSNCFNGHFMASLFFSFPAYRNGKIFYPLVPVRYRLWDKEKSKFVLAAGLMAQAITNLWKDKEVYALVTEPKNGKVSLCLVLMHG